MTDVQEQLGAARAALQNAEETLQNHGTFLERTAALLDGPDIPDDALESLGSMVEGASLLVKEQSARVKELRERLEALEVQQPEYEQYATAWLSYGHLRQAHVELIGVGEAPPDEVDIGDEADERALSEWLGFPFMNEYIDWAKTVRHPVGLDLSTWPHTLPDPPDEPAGAAEQLKPLLNDPDEAVRYFGYVALTTLAEARAVRDYKSGRSLS